MANRTVVASTTGGHGALGGLCVLLFLLLTMSCITISHNNVNGRKAECWVAGFPVHKEGESDGHATKIRGDAEIVGTASNLHPWCSNSSSC